MLNPIAGEAFGQFVGGDFKGTPLMVMGAKQTPEGKQKLFYDAKESGRRMVGRTGPIPVQQWVQALMQGGLTKDMAVSMAATMPFEFFGFGAQARDRNAERTGVDRLKSKVQAEGFTPARSALGRVVKNDTGEDVRKMTSNPMQILNSMANRGVKYGAPKMGQEKKLSLAETAYLKAKIIDKMSRNDEKLRAYISKALLYAGPTDILNLAKQQGIK